MTIQRFLARFSPGGVAATPVNDIAGLDRLALAIDHERLQAWVGHGTTWASVFEQGIVLGRIFPKRGEPEPARLASAARASGGRLLMSDWWGDWVALIEEPGQRLLRIVRAPSGGLHCFRERDGGTVWLASHAELLLSRPRARAIDWHFVAHALAYPALPQARTGVATIDEPAPGSCDVDSGAAATSQQWWAPAAFVRGPATVVDTAACAAELRSTIIDVTANLIRGQDRLVLELSGGLDSSIVAAALRAGDRSCSAANLVTPGGEGDERDYARLVAEHCRLDLRELPVPPPSDLTSPVPLSLRPGLRCALQAGDAALARVARDADATAFLDGAGGDAVFCLLGSAAPVVDALRVKDAGRTALRTLLNVATVHRSTIWLVAAAAVRARRRAGTATAWSQRSAGLAPERLPSVPHSHPWLEGIERLAPGKRAHLRSVLASYGQVDDFPRHALAPSLHPLLAQPVVELCLSIPAWAWVAGGRDRAVARRAFAGSLPPRITARRSKGAVDSYVREAAALQATALRQFLLDGLLADAGLLDLDHVAATLRQPADLADTSLYLLSLVDVETWLRRLAAALSR